ncbi:MAG: hypothetical protein HYW02_04040 [Deltaproteobacteria bacterium]|nr:hypothetical protein [Deltaproteobacteria bacterium]MBI2500635.1 hypothetical protein [Deltaproteobacteria bacterium]
MLRVLRWLFTWGLVAGLLWIILQLEYKGTPVKEHLGQFLKAPLIQEVFRQGKGVVSGWFKKEENGPHGETMDRLRDEDREALEEVLKKEGKE